MRPVWAVAWLGALFLLTASGERAAGESRLYWCPERSPDQRLIASPQAGCEPIAERESAEKGQIEKKPKRDHVKVEELVQETRRFLDDYRSFLSCCAVNPAAIDELEDLEERASALLKAADSGLFSEQIKLRGFTLRELITPIAQSRRQLRDLKRRWKSITESRERLLEMDYETVGRERRRIDEEEQAIQQQFRFAAPQPSPRTGMEIGTTPSMGPQIGVVPPTGPAVGRSATTGPEIGTTPPTGPDQIGRTPPTGFEIGTTGRAGPAIGDSSLNQR